MARRRYQQGSLILRRQRVKKWYGRCLEDELQPDGTIIRVHRSDVFTRANGTDVKVQSELLRHSNIGTILNVYTQAVSEQKRAAHGQIASQLLAV